MLVEQAAESFRSREREGAANRSGHRSPSRSFRGVTRGWRMGSRPQFRHGLNIGFLTP